MIWYDDNMSSFKNSVYYIGTIPWFVTMKTWFFGIIHCITNRYKETRYFVLMTVDVNTVGASS